MLPITIPRDDSAFLARFWAKVDKSAGPDGCWPWTGGRLPFGYGIFQMGTGPKKAHRVSWAMAHGSVPEDLLVLHRCDNPPCVNPDHLFLGTHADNASDKMKKGRHTPCPGDRNGMRKHPENAARGDRHGRYLHPEMTARGEQHGQAKLTEKEVRQILASTGRDSDIAERFNVSRTTVARIRSRRLWRHVSIP